MELLFIPLIFAILALLTPSSFMRILTLIGSLTSVVAVVFKFISFDPDSCISIFQLGANSLGFTAMMGLDGLSLVMVLLTNIIVLLILLSNYDNKHFATNKLFSSMIFFMQFGLIGVFTAFDGLLFYVFWELTLIPVFLLFLWFGEADRKKVLMKFFIYTFVGSLAMLFSLLYIGNMSESFSWIDLKNVELTAKTSMIVMTGFMLAFAIKIPLFPFHTWQPETYTKSPMAGTMLLSGLMLKMALYGMMRWMIPLADKDYECMRYLVIILGTIGVIYAAILAIKQNDIKKIFAYTSISHVGLIAAGIMVVSLEAYTGAVVQMVNHAFVAIGLFLSADIIDRRLGNRNILELGGIAKQAPRFAFWFACIVFAGVSVPLTSGFIGEFILIKSLYTYNWIIGVFIGTTLILACVYTFRAYQLSMFGPSKNFSFLDLSWSETTVFVIIMIVVVFLGVYPKFLIDIIEPSLKALLNIHIIK